MPLSAASCDGKVFSNEAAARAHGRGGIWYTWVGEGRNFPEDVESVWVCIPVNWGGDDNGKNYLIAEWTVSAKNDNDAQWSLSGTHDKPTLAPSLHWIRVWHGHLTNGRLESC